MDEEEAAGWCRGANRWMRGRSPGREALPRSTGRHPRVLDARSRLGPLVRGGRPRELQRDGGRQSRQRLGRRHGGREHEARQPQPHETRDVLERAGHAAST